jgi:hypothetical protein
VPALPGLLGALRPSLLSISTEAIGAFEYEEFEALERRRLRPRLVPRRGARDARSSPGLQLAARPVQLAAFYVQMATGILLGFLVGGARWVERLPALREPIRRAQLAALGVALLAGAPLARLSPSAARRARRSRVAGRTLGRAALMAFYALSVLRLLAGRGGAAGCDRSRSPGGCRSATTCCRRCSALRLLRLGLGLLERASPWAKCAGGGLFFLVQLPLSAWWLARFRYGRSSTSGAGSPTAGWTAERSAAAQREFLGQQARRSGAAPPGRRPRC